MASTTCAEDGPERVSTGDIGLDRVLAGGLLRGSVTIVQGGPGSGKTILANQMAFAHAAKGGTAVYLTLLSESHGRMTSHLRRLAFFDPNLVSSSVHYMSGFRAVTDEGAAGLLRLVGEEARRHKASMLVIDGLFAVEEALRPEQAFRQFVSDLTQLSELLDCTVLLLSNSQRTQEGPEFVMADGWIELGRQPVSFRTIRYLEVHKLRGSDFVPGRHMVDINDAGLAVMPRLEAVFGSSGATRAGDVLISCGVPSLDRLLGGGLSQGSTTLVLGPSGIGKTTTGLHLLSQCTPEAPGLIFGFYESEERLLQKAYSCGVDLEALLASKAVTLVWHAPTEQRLDALAYSLLEHVRRGGIRRLFVDGINAFEQSAVYPQRLGRFLSALTNELRALGCTTIFTSELRNLIGGEIEVSSEGVSPIAENILLMRYVELDSALHRTIVVVKVRDRDFDPRIHEFHISSRGIEIGDVFSKQEALLTGHAHSRRSPE